MPSTLRVYAVGDLLSPLYGPGGAPVPGRYAGRARAALPAAIAFDRDGRAPLPHQPIPVPAALPDGEEVPDCAEVRVALAHGDLSLVPQAPALSAEAPDAPDATPEGV